MRAIVLLAAVTFGSNVAWAHSWYDGLLDPAGRACCGVQDCHPVATCRTRSGAPGIEIEHVCREIPMKRVLRMPSPDDNAHACWVRLRPMTAPVIHCVILPGEA